jgi:hypothetical protein
MKKINKLKGISLGLAVFIIISMFFATGAWAGISCWSNVPNIAPNDLRGVAYGNGAYVAVGYQGTVMTSSDAEYWSLVNAGTSSDLFDVIFANNKFVAVGSTGGYFPAPFCMTSTDGQTWAINSTIGVVGASITYGNGIYVAVGQGGYATSTDGVTWQSYTNSELWLRGVTFGNGIFMAVGSNYWTDQPAIYTSSNGVTWSAANIASGPAGGYFVEVTFGGGKFVAIGTAGRVCTSSDAVNWTCQYLQYMTQGYSQGVAYGNGTYVIVPLQPQQIPGTPLFYTSQDAITWSPIYPILSGGFWRVKYLNDYFVAVGAGSYPNLGGIILKTCSFNADLSNLQLSSGTLYPFFSPATVNYTSSVDNSVSSITVTPTADDFYATVTVNGGTASSGYPSSPIDLTVGSNVINVGVTAQNGAVKTYTVDVTRRALSANADLSGLTLSSGTLNPAFAPSVGSYTASVENSISSITVAPTVQDSYATVTVNNDPVQSGSNSNPIALNEGSNSVTVVVTAQNGTQKTYDITITRAGSGLLIFDAENYDSMSGVSTEDCSDTGGGKDVYGIDTDDWINYVVNIPTSGNYTISYRVSNTGQGACMIELREGSTRLANTAIPANKIGWITLETKNIYLTAGQHTITLYAKKGNGFKLHWLKLTQQ